MYLAGNVEGWGDPSVYLKEIQPWGKNKLCEFYVAEVKEREQLNLTKNKFCEEQGECDDDVSQAGDQ